MLEEKALDTIKRWNMISFKDKILVGVSGGPDSISLLRFLLSLKTKYNLSIYIAHLNHLLRGKDSDEDEIFVVNMANELKLPYKVEKYNIHDYSRKKSISIEEAAREIRYRFYEKAATFFHATKIALGHNADDQVETVMMRIIRGCGLEGLKGIPPVRHHIIRPLIGCTRQEIEVYCCKNKLKYRVDLTNKKPIYFRNKVRLELLPFLLKEYNQNIYKNLLNLSNVASEVSGYFQMESERFFQTATHLITTDRIVLDLDKLNSCALALKREIIRRSIKEVKGDLNDITFLHISYIVRLMTQQSGEKYLDLPGNLKIKKTYNELFIFNESDISQNLNHVSQKWEYVLSFPKKTREIIELLKLSVETEIIEPLKLDSYKHSMNSPGEKKFYEFIDIDEVKLPFRIRNRRAGDKFNPLNMKGFKKIKDFFIDLKIAKNRRNKIPFLVDAEGKIVWIIGLRLDNRVKITKNTKNILCVKVVYIN